MKDEYKKIGHSHDKNWSGRKHRKRDKKRVKAKLKRNTKKEINASIAQLDRANRS